jgi:S1-C subfamily serine protease
MKLRIAFLAAFLVAAFVAATSLRHQTLGRWFDSRSATAPSATSATLWSEPPTVQGAGLSQDEVNNIEIYKRNKEATVNITSIVYRQNWFFEIYPQRGAGSGFLIRKDGLILTNNHVVSGQAPRITVTLDDASQHTAKVIFRDAANDLALLKIDGRSDLKVLPLGDSDKLQVGQKVLAIGNPFGLDQTLTTGIISALNREIADENSRKLDGLIQTDAAINPGNSGGPLFDSQGSVIGVNTAIYGAGGNIGIGFAMPINRAKLMLTAYESGKRYGRPWLGVEVALVQGDLAEELGLPAAGGLLVQRILRGSPAESAGLRGPRRTVVAGNFQINIGGDLIMAIDGETANRTDVLSRVMQKKRPGDPLRLTLFRNGSKVEVTVTLGELEGSI